MMGSRPRRGGQLAALGAFLTALIAMPLWSVAAASGGWTLTASPTSVRQGVATDIALTATNSAGGASVGCVEVQPSPEWTVHRVTVSSVPAGLNWIADPVTAGTNLVVVHGVTEADVLKADGTLVRFTVNVTGFAVGSYTWNASSRDHADCSAGIDVTSLSMSVVATAPTPSPPPSPTPSPPPTSRPTITATKSASVTPAASPTPAPSATPARSATPAPSTAASPAEGPSRSPATASSAPASPTAAPASSASDPGSLPSLDPFLVPGAETGGGGGADGIGAGIGSIWYGDVLVWVVPGVALSVPGLLLVVIVAAQAFGGLLWLPLARRRIGEFGIRRRGAR